MQPVSAPIYQVMLEVISELPRENAIRLSIAIWFSLPADLNLSHTYISGRGTIDEGISKRPAFDFRYRTF